MQLFARSNRNRYEMVQVREDRQMTCHCAEQQWMVGVLETDRWVGEAVVAINNSANGAL